MIYNLKFEKYAILLLVSILVGISICIRLEKNLCKLTFGHNAHTRRCVCEADVKPCSSNLTVLPKVGLMSAQATQCRMCEFTNESQT